MMDFDQHRARVERTGKRIRLIASFVMAVAAVGIVVYIGLVSYLAATLTPEGIGEFFGRIVSGFKAAQP